MLYGYVCDCCGAHNDSMIEYDSRFYCDDCFESEAMDLVLRDFDYEMVEREEDGEVYDAISIDDHVIILEDFQPVGFLRGHGARRVFEHLEYEDYCFRMAAG